ncbi:ferrous iron transport protein B, partial [Actinomadura logoneensis]
MDELAAAVAGLLDDPRPPVPPRLGAAEPVLAELEAVVADVPQLDGLPRRWLATALLSGDLPEETPEAVQAEAARLGDRLAAATGDPDDDLWDADAALADQRYAWAHEVLEASVRRDASADADTRTDKVDRVLTSRVFGLPILLAVMWAVFSATTTFAKPLQDGLAALFDGPVTRGADAALSWAPAWLNGLVVQGLVGGVGQVLSFIPLMIVMFVLMTLLEDSGYLARAAFLADRLMRTMGLPSRAFLPLLVGFGCNVPALSATRILPNARQRLLLGLVIPYLSCSARLVVYVLMASVFFGSMAGTVVFGMYVLSIVMVVAVGLLLRRTLFRDVTHEPLVLELPPYRVPTVRVTAAQTWVRLRGFLRTASGIIVGTVTAVWLLSSISLQGEPFGKGPIDDSAMAGISRAVAPAFEPLGFGDWHPAAAMVTGFVAKEAVVATMAQTYAVAEPGDDHRPGALGDRIKATFERTSGGHPTPAALAFLVFLLAYTPCMTTVATQWQAIGRRLTLYGMGMQLAIAWVLALAVFQIGRLL